jgi:O-antigen/teichoic acid export membrane protein
MRGRRSPEQVRVIAGMPDAAAADPHVAGDGATTGAHVLGSGMWKMLSNALPQLYTLVLSVAAARYLGPSGMGRQSFIAFVEASTVTLLSASFSTALMRYVGESVGAGQAGAARWLARRLLAVQLAAAAVGAGTLVVVAALGGRPQAAWLLAACTVASSIVATVPGAVLTGLQRWRQATIAGLTTSGIGVAAAIAVLAAGGGITGMFAVEAVTTVAALTWTSLLARGALERLGPAVPTPGLLRRTLRFGVLSLGGTVLYLIVWRRSEFFFLQHYSSDRQIAFYSIAFAVATGVVRLPAAMGEVLAPAVATLLGAGAHDRIRSGFSRALRLLVLVTLPVTAAAAAVGPEALRVIWGPDFAGAVYPFLVMVASSVLTPVTVLSASLVAGVGRVGVPLVAEALAAAVDVGLAFALVPHHGALGAAIASSSALLASGLLLLLYANRLTGPIRFDGWALVRGVAFAAAGGAVAWGLVTAVGGVGGIVLGLAGGAVVFSLLGLLVGFLPRDDAEWLHDVLAGHAGEVPARVALAFAGRRQ